MDLPSSSKVTQVRYTGSSSAAPLPPYRWYALAVLFLASIMNTIDKQLVPALAEPLRAEFGLSDTELGFLAGLVFSVSYGLAAIPIGILIDRLNRSRLLAGLLAAWSILTILSSRTNSFIALALCRMGVAAAESGGNPTSLSLISDYFPREQRSRAIGIFSANAAIAGLLVFSLAGLIAAEYGWRAAFALAGLPGLILSVIILLTLREPARGTFDPPTVNGGDQERPGVIEVVKSVFANKTLLFITAAGVLVIMGQTGSSAFMAAFFVRIHELPIERAGLITGLVLSTGLFTGTIGGGFIADYMAKKSRGGGAFFVAGATVLAVPFAVLGFTVPSLIAAMGFIFVFMVLGTCFYGATLAMILDLSPLAMRGAIVTYVTLVLNLCGYGLGPQFTGIFSDLFRLGGTSDPLRWGMVTVVSLLVISAMLYYFAGRRLQREPA